MQGETAKTANLDAVTASQRRTHLLEYGFDAKLHIQMSEVPLYFSQLIDQFRFSHRKLTISLIFIVILISGFRGCKQPHPLIYFCGDPERSGLLFQLLLEKVSQRGRSAGGAALLVLPQGICQFRIVLGPHGKTERAILAVKTHELSLYFIAH